MSNGEVCCILGICCPPATIKRSVIPELARDLGLTEAQAETAYDWFASRVDFVPKGTGQPMIDAVVHLAKAHP